MTEQKPLNIHQRIHAVMKDVKIIVKEKKTANGMYRFVSHDAVVKEIRPLLIKHGIVVIPSVVKHEWENFRTTMELELSFVNIDKPEDSFVTRSFGYGIDKQDKGIGKAYSYAFKYTLLKTFCCETGDDPEQDNVDYKPKSVRLATQEQIDEFIKLTALLEISEDTQKQWLVKARVESFEEMSFENMQKCLIYLKEKIK